MIIEQELGEKSNFLRALYRCMIPLVQDCSAAASKATKLKYENVLNHDKESQDWVALMSQPY